MDIPATLENGRYVLRRPLGRGGTATVFEAWDTRLGEAVAVKLLTGGDTARRSLRRRLRAETQAMRSVNHRNVLRVIDLRAEGDVDYVVMDLAPGGSLQDRLDTHGPLPVGEAVGYIEQILAALAAAHAARVVHRDVKPQNVLLDAEGVALLADFGIARVRRNEGEAGLTRMGVAMGSFAYMPPEQRLDAHDVDERADVYAAGATLYALLTAGNPVDLFTAGPTSARWAGVPPPLVEVLRVATAQNREDRYPGARAFGRALAEVVATLPPEVLAAPSLPPGGGIPAPPPIDDGWRQATREAVTFLRLATPPAPPPETRVWGSTGQIDTSLGEGEPYAAGTAAPDSVVHAEPHVRAPAPEAPSRTPVVVGGVVVALLLAVAGWAWSQRGGDGAMAAPGPVAGPEGGAEAVSAEAVSVEAVPAEAVPAEVVPAEPVVSELEERAPVGGGSVVGAPAVGPPPAAAPPAAPKPAPSAVPDGGAQGSGPPPEDAGAESGSAGTTDGLPLGRWRGAVQSVETVVTLRGTSGALTADVVFGYGGSAVSSRALGSYDPATRVVKLTDTPDPARTDLGRYELRLSDDAARLDGYLYGDNGQMLPLNLKPAR